MKQLTVDLPVLQIQRRLIVERAMGPVSSDERLPGDDEIDALFDFLGMIEDQLKKGEEVILIKSEEELR